MAKKIIIIAGEPSGDLHASHLINNLKKISPDIEVSGLGGKLMKEAGAKIYYDLTDIAVIGFFEVIKNLKKFKSAFNLLLEKIDSVKPDAVILIDYPGFNLKIASRIKEKGIPIVYYISPQVWAWGKKRINIIKKLIDKMIVVFKFEEELYKKEGVDVYFAGHPLLEITRPSASKETIINKHELDDSKRIIILLPGSRENEVKKILPIMLKTVSILHKKMRGLQFLVVKSPSVKDSIYEETIRNKNLPLKLLLNDTYNLLSASDFALVCSGTATLETAILGIPMVIVYKVSFLSWLFIKALIKIPYIGLVNLVAKKKIVPEFIQYNTEPKKISKFIIDSLSNKNKIKKIKEELLQVKNCLGNAEASRKTAEYIVNFLNEN